MKKEKIRNFEDAAFGEEPCWWEDVTLDSNIDMLLGKAFNWYNYTKTNKDSKEYLLKYLKSTGCDEQARNINRLKDWEIPLHVGWTARMLSLGCTVLEKETFDKFLKRIESLNEKGMQIKEEIQEAKENKIIPFKEKLYLASIDDLIDNFLETFKKDYDTFETILSITKNPKEQQEMMEHVKAIHSEVLNAQNKTHQDFVEIYSFLSKANLNKYEKFLSELIVSLKQTSSVSKTRAPRKKKINASKTKTVINVDYCKEFPELGLTSLPIENSINTKNQTLVFYNVVSRDVCIFEKSTEFSYKGKSLTGFDEEKSYSIKLRDPKTIVPALSACGKREYSAIMKSINAKRKPLKGKLNANMLLLRIF